jgi:hypothetical protein
VAGVALIITGEQPMSFLPHSRDKFGGFLRQILHGEIAALPASLLHPKLLSLLSENGQSPLESG